MLNTCEITIQFRNQDTISIVETTCVFFPTASPWLPTKVTTILNFVLLFSFDVLKIGFFLITYAYFPKHFILLVFEYYKNGILYIVCKLLIFT